jgi:hypothetical protein
MVAATTKDSEAQVVQRAAVRAVAYADVFGYPLDAGEIGRYLHGVVATDAATRAALAHVSGPCGPLGQRDGFYTLRGREDLVARRRERAANATRLWPVALWYGRLIARLPFVRMVAVTGSLAWDNVEADGDIDYLVVTEPDRLWVCRWMIAVLTELHRLAGVPLCPNYVISERALTLSDRNLYTAYELAQMKPLAGYEVYRQIREMNPWVQSFLPNAPALQPPLEDRWPAHPGTGALLVRAARLAEPLLRSQVGAAFDRFEMAYRIRKWTGRAPRQPGTEAEYNPDCCKAHTTAHKGRVLTAFAERLARLETPGS